MMEPVICALTTSTAPFINTKTADDEFGGIAERNVEEAADRSTGDPGNLLCRLANVLGERNDRSDGCYENPDRGHMPRVPERNGHRDE